MALNVWTQPSGYSLGTLDEGIHISIPLPTADDSGVNYVIVSGALPTGLFLIDNTVTGTPFATNNQLLYQFCIRASSVDGFADRTFTLTIQNIAQPEFITPAGELPAGPHHQFYVLDGSFVNYQISAVDLNPEPGEVLSFTIEDGNGILPPGLELTKSGLITGFITTAVYTPVGDPTTYAVPYDFTVTITDGINFNTRTFEIFVADPDAFRADSEMLDGLAGRFTSDSTYLQQPVWITDANLGVHRANNYLTLPVGLYDRISTLFRIETTNMEVYANTLQVSSGDNNINKLHLTVTNVNGTLVNGQHFTFANYFAGAGSTIYRITDVADLGNGNYRLTLNTPLTQSIDNGIPFYIGSLSELPPGLSFDNETSELYGRIPYQPAVTETYTFTITATRTYAVSNETTTTSRTFTITLLGDITSEITWVTPSDLGTLHANYVSTLNLVATSNISNANLVYSVTEGSLPPGITLSVDGELIGTVNQYYNTLSGQQGLLTFDDGMPTIFDSGTTTYDRSYTFTVTVNDQFLYTYATRTFTVKIDEPNTIEYTDIYAHPFLAQAERNLWRSFITDAGIFTPSSIYRPNDPNFGVRPGLEMLIYAGIETTTASAFATSMTNGFKRKRFIFSSIETALAIDPESGNSVYEVVYAKMHDPMEPDGIKLPEIIHGQYYTNSISNWRSRISNGLITERNYLPLWMRTIQPGTKEQLDYTLAVPLCYCKVGKAADIVLNIKYSGFDFKQLDYTLDRFIVNSVIDPNTGAVDVSDKYLAFRDNRTTI
jgi:hypothetical protein